MGYMTLRRVAALFRVTFSRWQYHEATRLGASIAFYALLSLAPLLVLSVGLLSSLFGRQQVERHVLFDWTLLVGRTGANTIQGLMSGSQSADHGKLATAMAGVMMLIGASGVFGELRAALNKMWDVAPPVSSFLSVFLGQVAAFALVLGVGGVLLLSLCTSAAVSLLTRVFSGRLVFAAPVLETANFLLSVGLTTVLFMLIFRFVPGRRLPWRTVGMGAGVTSLLFAIGKTLLGWYFAWAGVGSVYGAAGSLVAIVFWVFYSSQIFLFGAEFTNVWAEMVSRADQTAQT